MVVQVLQVLDVIFVEATEGWGDLQVLVVIMHMEVEGLAVIILLFMNTRLAETANLAL